MGEVVWISFGISLKPELPKSPPIFNIAFKSYLQPSHEFF